MILKEVSGMDKNQTRPISDGNPTYVEGFFTLTFKWFYVLLTIFMEASDLKINNVLKAYTHTYMYIRRYMYMYTTYKCIHTSIPAISTQYTPLSLYIQNNNLYSQLKSHQK